MDLPLNLQEREKYFLYSEMILQLQMARDHLLLQQSEKVSTKKKIVLLFFSTQFNFFFCYFFNKYSFFGTSTKRNHYFSTKIYSFLHNLIK